MNEEGIWDNLSEDYLNQFYTTEYILLPAILEELKDVKNKSILDLGCGVGYFSEIFLEKNARVVGLDSSKKMIKIAKTKNKKINYILGNAENLSEYSNEKFDYVLAVMFFCCVDNSQRFERIFSEIKKALKEDGEIIVVDYHPRGYKDIDTYLLKHKIPESFNYFNSPQRFKVELRNKKDKLLKFFDFHWRLEDYGKIADNLNLWIEKIKGLRPTANLEINNKNVLDYFKRDPVYMLLKLSKR
jgi:ubiquinone/menaquinone biosynthesis C-methylase UbiE